MGLRSTQKDQRRQKILESAEQILREDGPNGLTMRKVASGAGLTMPTIYALIGDRAAVIAELTTRWNRRFNLLLDAEEAEGLDPLGVVELGLRELQVDSELYRSLMVCLTTMGELRESLEAGASFYQTWTNALARGVASLERLHALSSGVDATALLSAIRDDAAGLVSFWALGGIPHDRISPTIRFSMASLLSSSTQGAARKRYQSIAKDAHKELTKLAPSSTGLPFTQGGNGRKLRERG
jgi:AcrR family transcriptional regulator